MPSTVAVTGPQTLSPQGEDYLRRVLADQDAPDTLISGGCIGADWAIAEWFSVYRLNTRQVIYRPSLPQAPGKAATAVLDGRFTIRLIGGDELARNRAMIGDADELWAFPRTANEVRRSGTWATIRYAVAHGLPVRVWPLNGSRPWEERVDAR